MGSPRILLVRTSALGDVVHALPVLNALRRARPAARIAWVVEEPFAPLLEAHSAIDQLLPVRLRLWRRRPFARHTLRQVGRFLRALNDFSAEVVLDLMGNHKAGAIGALTLADRRIGLHRRYRREPSSALWNSLGVEPFGRHAVDRGLSLLQALEIEPGNADFAPHELFPDAPAVVDGRRPGDEAPFVVMLPGAGWGNKRYPARWWGAVAHQLGERLGIASWVVPGPGEEVLAREAHLAAPGWVRVVHAGSLAALAAVLRPARLVLGGDTGPLHLAHALGVPVLCLMGPTDPADTGPYGQPERALWHRLPCSFCNRRFDQTKACLLSLPPARVARSAAALLA